MAETIDTPVFIVCRAELFLTENVVTIETRLPRPLFLHLLPEEWLARVRWSGGEESFNLVESLRVNALFTWLSEKREKLLRAVACSRRRTQKKHSGVVLLGYHLNASLA